MAGNYWDADPINNAPRATKGGAAKPPPEDPHGEVLENSGQRDKRRDVMDSIEQVDQQLRQVERLYNKNFRGSGISSLMEYVPGLPANTEFDTETGQLAKLARPTQRTPGEGSMSDFESKLALQALPDRWSNDSTNEAAIRGLRRFIDTSRVTYAKRLGLPTPPPAAQRVSRHITIDANGNVIK